MLYPYTYEGIVKAFYRDIEKLKKDHLGSTSHLKYSLRALKDLSPEERQAAAKDLHRATSVLEEFFDCLPKEY